MTMFEDRERAFEAMFAHQEDIRFRAAARRNRRLGLWAADRMGFDDRESADYADFVVRVGAWFGDEGVRQRLLHDLTRAGAAVSGHRLSRMMHEELAGALQETGKAAARLDEPVA